MDSDLESDNSVFDVKSPTRENGGRRASATTNNNTTCDNSSVGVGSDSCQTTVTKAVRSNSENTGDSSCEKTCITTMSGSSIA